jgi:intein/homing endonuclease
MTIEGHPVEVVELEIFEHLNADRLEVAIPIGTDWSCVVGKGQFKTGDLGVYIPIDSIIDDAFFRKYLADSKITLKKNRIRSVNIRKQLSQGLIISPDANWQLGQDVQELLNIQKYEPPKPPWWKEQTQGKKKSKKEKKIHKKINDLFPKYTKIKNHKYYKGVLQEGEVIVCLEKIHGCLHKDTQILMANGDKLPISEVQAGDKIISCVNDCFIIQEVEASIVRPAVKTSKLKWLELSFDNGNDLICTEDHKILTYNGWKQAKDLEPTDNIMAYE